MDGSSHTHGIHSVNDSSSMLNNLSFLITPCFTYKYALSSIVEKSFEVIRVSLLLIIQKYVETLICTPYLLSISDNIPKAIVAWSQLYGSPAPVLSLPCLLKAQVEGFSVILIIFLTFSPCTPQPVFAGFGRFCHRSISLPLHPTVRKPASCCL